MRKFDAQFAALRGVNSDTCCVVFSGSKLPATHPYSLAWLGGMSRAQMFTAAANMSEMLRPDIIYFRFPYFDEYCYDFVVKCPNTVFELHELPAGCPTEALFENDLLWGPKVLRECLGITAVTNGIKLHEQARSGRELPSVVIGNGIRLDVSIPCTRRPPLGSELHIAFVAAFSHYHGLDRLLEGMRLYGKKNVYLHLAGIFVGDHGRDRDYYMGLVRNAGLEGQIIEHGLLDDEQMYALFAKCHLASGTLAISRNNLFDMSSLKHRTYAWAGIPFFYAGTDADFNSKLPFVLVLPDDESPIDMERIWDFARITATMPDIGTQMRVYAREHLSWEAKSHELMAFFESLPPRQTTDENVLNRDEAAVAENDKNNSPLFSCLIACGTEGDETADKLNSALESVARQNEANTEIILAYRGSNAAARRVGRDFADKYGDKCLLREVVSEGGNTQELLQEALGVASGRWVLTLPPGCAVADGFLSRAAELIEAHPEYSLIAGRLAWGGQQSGALPRLPHFWRRYFLVRPFIVRREAAHAMHGGYGAGNAWRKGDKKFRQKCRRDGLPERFTEEAMLCLSGRSLKEKICRWFLFTTGQ